MRKINFAILIILLITGFSACTMEKSEAETVEKQLTNDKPKSDGVSRKPVLIELFTSEG
jgi:hypothetical protein